METVTIRMAEERDFATVRHFQLALHVQERPGTLTGPVMDAIDQGLRMCFDLVTSQVFVAERAGKVFGCIIATALDATSVEIGGLYVERGFPHTTALRLMQAVGEWAAGHGFTAVGVTTSMQPARALHRVDVYRKLGLAPQVVIYQGDIQSVLAEIDGRLNRRRSHGKSQEDC